MFKFSNVWFRQFSVILLQRVVLFNAYAMQAMCKAGVEVLDVFPISDSYPAGTGLPNKPYDAVHYKGHVFQPVVNLLQTYFGS